MKCYRVWLFLITISLRAGHGTSKDTVIFKKDKGKEKGQDLTEVTPTNNSKKIHPFALFKKIIKSSSDPNIPHSLSKKKISQSPAEIEEEDSPSSIHSEIIKFPNGFIKSYRQITDSPTQTRVSYEIYDRQNNCLGTFTVSPPNSEQGIVLSECYELATDCREEKNWNTLCTLITSLINTSEVENFLEAQRKEREEIKEEEKKPRKLIRKPTELHLATVLRNKKKKIHRKSV